MNQRKDTPLTIIRFNSKRENLVFSKDIFKYRRQKQCAKVSKMFK